MITLSFISLALFSVCFAEIMANRVVSTVVRLGDIAYYMHPKSTVSTTAPLLVEPYQCPDIPKVLEVDIPNFKSSQTAEPCTLLTVNGSFPTADQLRTTFQSFAALDDVWSSDFLQSVIIQIADGERSLTRDEKTVLKGFGAQDVYVFHRGTDMTPLPEGPYFLDHGRIHEAYRLFPDTSGAFVVATVPTEDDG